MCRCLRVHLSGFLSLAEDPAEQTGLERHPPDGTAEQVVEGKWPSMFIAERDRVAIAFGAELVAAHHVGNTAVPGLAPKPEIDLLVEVHTHQDTHQVDNFVRSCGYFRGKYLTAEHHFYRKNENGVRTHKVHVCTTDHCQIARRGPGCRKLVDLIVVNQESKNKK